MDGFFVDRLLALFNYRIPTPTVFSQLLPQQRLSGL